MEPQHPTVNDAAKAETSPPPVFVALFMMTICLFGAFVLLIVAGLHLLRTGHLPLVTVGCSLLQMGMYAMARADLRKVRETGQVDA